MVSPDANILIYAYDEASSQHKKARAWLSDALNSGITMGIPMQSILAFLRITSDPRILTNPLELNSGLLAVNGWLQRPYVHILSPGPIHWRIFRDLCEATKATGKLTTDVHLAALAIEHSSTLISGDRDFLRFLGLRWHNPLLIPNQ